MDVLQVIAIALAAVGALNWGLVAVAKFDLVAALTGSRFGEVNPLSRVVYLLVMVAGLVGLTATSAILD